jgi:putative membrane protein
MEAVLQSFLSGSPVLLLHFAVTVAMLAVGMAVYVWMTPHDELRLIRDGNLAAAISLAGAIVGIGLPLAFCMAASFSIWDILIWGTLTVVVQLVVFKVADLLLKDLPTRIEAGEVGPALVLAAIKLAVAGIYAAAVSG